MSCSNRGFTCFYPLNLHLVPQKLKASPFNLQAKRFACQFVEIYVQWKRWSTSARKPFRVKKNPLNKEPCREFMELSETMVMVTILRGDLHDRLHHVDLWSVIIISPITSTPFVATDILFMPVELFEILSARIWSLWINRTSHYLGPLKLVHRMVGPRLNFLTALFRCPHLDFSRLNFHVLIGDLPALFCSTSTWSQDRKASPLNL